jgi:2-alkyl-3-oxoalkanoate reductase
MTVLVTGATGFLGQHLVQTLLAHGQPVRALGRNVQVLARLASWGATPVQADLSDALAVAAACRGARAVVHAGALSSPWGRRADFWAANVAGSAHVIAGCQQHAVPRLVHISSPSVVFGGEDHDYSDESVAYPHQFTSLYSQSKQEAELLALAFERAIVLRPKAIYGPGDSSLLPRLIAAARAGRLPQIGDGQNQVDLSYVSDVVDAILLAIDAPQPANQALYTITSGEHPLLWPVIARVLAALGLPKPQPVLPLALALAAATAMERWSEISGQEPRLTRYSALILARQQTYNISAAERGLGYRPKVGIEEGLERTIAALLG